MSDPADGAEQRIEALEIRLAYQDDTIEKLNAAIADQWTQIDALTRQFAELRERLQDTESRAPAAAGHEPPPHY